MQSIHGYSGASNSSFAAFLNLLRWIFTKTCFVVINSVDKIACWGIEAHEMLQNFVIDRNLNLYACSHLR